MQSSEQSLRFQVMPWPPSLLDDEFLALRDLLGAMT
jgi:hypothetical protein